MRQHINAGGIIGGNALCDLEYPSDVVVADASRSDCEFCHALYYAYLRHYSNKPIPIWLKKPDEFCLAWANRKINQQFRWLKQ